MGSSLFKELTLRRGRNGLWEALPAEGSHLRVAEFFLCAGPEPQVVWTLGKFGVPSQR